MGGNDPRDGSLLRSCGASEGYRQAGFEITAVADNDEVALASHLENHPEEPGHGCEHHLIDLADPTDFIGYWTPGEFDLIHGSPPCTAFSSANNNPDPNVIGKLGMLFHHQ